MPSLQAWSPQIEADDGNAVALAGDVRSEAYAKALVALAVEKFGRLDVAFNNAGTLGEAGPSTAVSEAGWNDAIAINLTGSFLGAKHQIAEMLKHGGGSVIFTSTFVGYSFAFPGVAADAASKSGLIGLTEALAAEFGPRGVRVNAILPGAVETGRKTPASTRCNGTASAIGCGAMVGESLHISCKAACPRFLPSISIPPCLSGVACLSTTAPVSLSASLQSSAKMFQSFTR